MPFSQAGASLAARWEKVRHLLQFFRNLLKGLFDLSAADWSFPVSTGNANLIIMPYDFAPSGSQNRALWSACGLSDCS
jgi:hypothetical protein